VAAVDSTKQLAWEARQRPRAGIVALLAALLTVGPDLWTASLFRDAPHALFLDGLLKAVQPGPVGPTPSLRTPYFEYVHSHAGAFLAANVIKAIGYVCVAWVLTFLIAAARARRPEVARPLLYVGLVGGVLSAIATILFPIAYNQALADFLAGPDTVDRAAAAGNGSLLTTSQFIGLAGQLALAVGYVLVALNAMRVGLLTRFMGVLGCIIGALVILPLAPLPILQGFWLAALGALLLGRWPSGMPPAWTSGKAEPWPTKVELAAQRRATLEARRAARGEAAATTDELSDGASQPGGPRRKRKRRS
jgi:hypothetical protein